MYIEKDLTIEYELFKKNNPILEITYEQYVNNEKIKQIHQLQRDNVEKQYQELLLKPESEDIGTEIYHRMYTYIAHYLNIKDYIVLNDYIKKFDNDKSNSGELRTILVSLKPFKNKEMIFTKTFNNIYDRLKEKNGGGMI